MRRLLSCEVPVSSPPLQGLDSRGCFGSGSGGGPSESPASGAGPAGGARALPAREELGGCRRGGGGGGTAGGGLGSGNMSGEWRPRRCHRCSRTLRALCPHTLRLPQGRSPTPEPWPWVCCTALTFPGLALLSPRPFFDSQLPEQRLLPSPAQALPARRSPWQVSTPRTLRSLVRASVPLLPWPAWDLVPVTGPWFSIILRFRSLIPSVSSFSKGSEHL